MNMWPPQKKSLIVFKLLIFINQQLNNKSSKKRIHPVYTCIINRVGYHMAIFQ